MSNWNLPDQGHGPKGMSDLMRSVLKAGAVLTVARTEVDGKKGIEVDLLRPTRVESDLTQDEIMTAISHIGEHLLGTIGIEDNLTPFERLGLTGKGEGYADTRLADRQTMIQAIENSAIILGIVTEPGTSLFSTYLMAPRESDVNRAVLIQAIDAIRERAVLGFYDEALDRD